MEMKEVHGLKGIQGAIGGGHFEIVRPSWAYEQGVFETDQIFLCDEDGLYKKMKVNPLGVLLSGNLIVGDILVLRTGDEDFTDLTEEDAKLILKRLVKRVFTLQSFDCEVALNDSPCTVIMQQGDAVETVGCDLALAVAVTKEGTSMDTRVLSTGCINEAYPMAAAAIVFERMSKEIRKNIENAADRVIKGNKDITKH